MTEESSSEFGAGIVVCLAKFSEHLWNGQDPSMNKDIVDIWVSEDEGAAYSRAVELWANGASDHFYDLDEKAPAPLKELASLTLKMGHGFTGQKWTKADMDRVRELWRESCLAVDRMLEVEPDWGQW